MSAAAAAVLNPFSAAPALAQALALPATSHVGQRIAKSLFAEQIASLPGTTAADKRLANDLLVELHWLAALKPATCGLAAWQTETHTYLEIAVLHAVLRSGLRAPTAPSKSQRRLIELIHRAIPYPVVQIISQPSEDGEQSPAQLSLAHKRLPLNASSAVVLEQLITTKSIALHAGNTPATRQFLQYFAFNTAATSNLRNLHARYSDWLHAAEALAASEHTGQFQVSASEAEAAQRRIALANFEKINLHLTSLRAQARKASQLGSRAVLNQQIADLMAQRQAVLSRL